MDEYVQKYLDGDLSDAEAALFAQAIARDPALEAELREIERILAVAASSGGAGPSDAFSDNVMLRVAQEDAARQAMETSRASFFDRVFDGARSWGVRLAWVASFALVFVVGYMLADRPGKDLTPTVSTPDIEAVAAASSPSVRLARLVYLPQNPEVQRVSVAGTFNGWDPAVTTMQREGNMWVALMALPPEVYEYMFVEDGKHWITDPLATQTRDDGFGRENAVLDLTM